MDASTLTRRITFGLVVFVLVALGAYLIGPIAHGSSRARRPATLPRPAPSATSGSLPAGLGTSAAGQPGSSAAPDIYQWLPFTPAGLGTAASVARRFAAAYGTFSYTQTAAAYTAPLASLATSQLIGQIAAAYSVPGVAAARSQARQVSAGTAVIESIRAFGPTSLTFVVQLTEHLMASSGSSQLVTLYALTLTGAGSAWQVSDIQLAAAGNA